MKCGAPNPENPAQSCILEKSGHADHFDRDGHHWVDQEVIERMRLRRRHKPGPGTKKGLTRLAAETARGLRQGARLTTGVPEEAERAWSRDEWQEYATGVFRDFLRSRVEEFTTPEHVWPLLHKPGEMRAMVLVRNRMVNSGYMKEVGAKRLRGVYRTLDGFEFEMNKLVPIYRSLLSESPSGSETRGPG